MQHVFISATADVNYKLACLNCAFAQFGVSTVLRNWQSRKQAKLYVSGLLVLVPGTYVKLVFNVYKYIYI